MQAARVAGSPIPVEELPVAVGIAQLHADVLADMPATVAAGGRNSAAARLLARPNPDEPRRSTTHKIVQSLYWTGNAYVLSNGSAVTVLDPNAVAVDYDDADPNRIAGWWIDGNRPPAGTRVYHVKIYDDPRRGPLGRSPFRAAREPLDMYGHAYRYLSMFFAGGGNPSTVLQRTGATNTLYSPEQAAEDWITARQNRRPAVLPAGWELSVPPNNGELEAVARVLEHSAAEVARLTGVPPSLANARSQSTLTYSNTAGEFRRWLAVSLAPTWIGRLEDLWTDIAGVPVEIDTSNLFRLVDPTDNGAAAPVLNLTERTA